MKSENDGQNKESGPTPCALGTERTGHDAKDLRRAGLRELRRKADMMLAVKVAKKICAILMIHYSLHLRMTKRSHFQQKTKIYEKYKKRYLRLFSSIPFS